MSFLAPERLLLLILVGLLGLAYVLLRLRASRYALRFTNLELLRSVAPRAAGWRRHLLAGLSLVALAALVVALARPAQERELATERATIVLAIDTSLSMQATDVEPSRLDVAKQAATDFVDVVPEGVDVGIVAFDGTARLESRPSADRDETKQAIDTLELGRGTAIGDAIFLGLGALSDSDARLASIEAGPEEESAMNPGRLVVMSDGETTAGRENADAVGAAREVGVEISTIAYGTDRGTVMVQGETIPVPVNRDALAQIANESNGVFYEAASGEELSQVFDDIGTAIELDTVTEELSLWFVAFGMAFSALAAVGSLVWFSRLP